MRDPWLGYDFWLEGSDADRGIYPEPPEACDDWKMSSGIRDRCARGERPHQEHLEKARERELEEIEPEEPSVVRALALDLCPWCSEPAGEHDCQPTYVRADAFTEEEKDPEAIDFGDVDDLLCTIGGPLVEKE